MAYQSGRLEAHLGDGAVGLGMPSTRLLPLRVPERLVAPRIDSSSVRVMFPSAITQVSDSEFWSLFWRGWRSRRRHHRRCPRLSAALLSSFRGRGLSPLFSSERRGVRGPLEGANPTWESFLEAVTYCSDPRQRRKDLPFRRTRPMFLVAATVASIQSVERTLRNS